MAASMAACRVMANSTPTMWAKHSAWSSCRKASPEFIRPPLKLCDGCSHTDAFLALNEALEAYGRGRVFSDIGCYTLKCTPNRSNPSTVVWIWVLRSPWPLAAADAGLVPTVAAIGDSTFTHSGITGLLDAVNNNSPITVLSSTMPQQA